MSGNRQRTQEPRFAAIPDRVLDGLKRQAQELGLGLAVESDNQRCSITDGDTALAGPFTHGSSANSFLDGFRRGERRGRTRGEEAGKAAGRIEGETKAAGGKPRVYVMRTGNTYHAYFLVGNEWKLVNSPKNPAFSMGAAIEVAAQAHGLTDFAVEYADRTAEVVPA